MGIAGSLAALDCMACSKPRPLSDLVRSWIGIPYAADIKHICDACIYRYLLFLFSSVLLLGLRESRRRAEAGKPHTLTPPLMVGA